jgi:hypothetical protein
MVENGAIILIDSGTIFYPVWRKKETDGVENRQKIIPVFFLITSSAVTNYGTKLVGMRVLFFFRNFKNRA